MNGCSDGGGGNDGGTSSDAGKTDAGKTDAGKTDAGTSGHALGSRCTNPNGMQSNCDRGLKCYGISELNECTKLCQDDSECGSTNGVANTCWGGVCLVGCDSSADPSTSPCGRDDFTCVPKASDSTDGICFPDCRVQKPNFCGDFFGYPFDACDKDATMGGSCFNVMSCTGAACPSGQACYTIDAMDKVCTAECTATGASCTANEDCATGLCESGTCQGCPAGYNCDSGGKKTCGLQMVGNYDTCYAFAQCPRGNTMTGAGQNICLHFDQNPPAQGLDPGLCLQFCTQTSDCPAGQTCDLQLVSGDSLCIQACDDDSTCPANTVCADPGVGATICVPGTRTSTPDAGTPVDAGTTEDLDGGVQ